MSHVALPDWLDFRPRLFPSCNFVWLAGRTPVLVDSGFGSDLGATLEMLPGDPALLFNTHWHSDHVGGNAELGSWYGMPIAASAAEGTRVNAGDPEAFGSDWLDQPVDLHGVDRLLEPGELVETGTVRGLHPCATSPAQAPRAGSRTAWSPRFLTPGFRSLAPAVRASPPDPAHD